MVTVVLLDTDEQRAIMDALVDEGWDGKWKRKDGKIQISNCEGTLQEYLDKNGPLDYFQTVILALNLGTQIIALASLGKGLPTLAACDITICDGGFVISDLSKVLFIDGDLLHITRPIDLQDHVAPEMKLVDRLPFSTPVSAIYYSIALLCLECLAITSEMREIHGSKLYYLLDRCMRKDPETREFLYI